MVAAGSLSSRALSLQHLAQRHHYGDSLHHTGLLQPTGLVTFLPVRLAIGHLSCSRDDQNGTLPPLPPLPRPLSLPSPPG